MKDTMEQFIAAAQKFLTDVVFTNLPKIVFALVVLWIGWKLIKLLNKAINKVYERHTVDKSLQQFLNSLIDIGLKILLFLTVIRFLPLLRLMRKNFPREETTRRASSFLPFSIAQTMIWRVL